MIFVMIFSLFIAAIDAFMVLTVLPQIGRDLHVSDATLSWVSTANLLTIAGLQMLAGRLTDFLGQRRALVIGLLIYMASSLCSALSPDFVTLVLARILAGIGMALVSTAAFSIITTVIPEGRYRERAFGALAMKQGVSLVFALTLVGSIADAVGWRGVFWISMVLSGTAAMTAFLAVPPSAAKERIPLSTAPAAALLTMSISCIMWAIAQLSSAGRLHGAAIAFAVAIFGLALFLLREATAPERLIPLTVLRSRGFVVGAITCMLTMAGTVPVFALPNLYMQDVLGYSSAKAGVAMIPFAVASFASGSVTAASLHRWQKRWVAIGGLGCATVGSLLLAMCAPLGAHGGYMLTIGVGGPLVAIGYTVAGVATLALTTNFVAPQQQGTATGVAMMAQYIGSSSGIQLTLGFLSAGSAGATVRSADAFQLPYFIMGAIAFVGLMLCFLKMSSVPRRTVPSTTDLKRVDDQLAPSTPPCRSFAKVRRRYSRTLPREIQQS
jgi:MFS family permease